MKLLNMFRSKPAWGKWKDVAIVKIGYDNHLIQARKHNETRVTEFRYSEAKYACNQVTIEAMKKAGLWENDEGVKVES